LGEFLRSLLFIDRRWVRLDSCSNNTVLPDGAKEGINSPIEAFCDLLGVSARKANDYLHAANLMKKHNVHKTFGPNAEGWRELISEYGLEAELVQTTDYKHLGAKVWVLRIGCLSKNNNYMTFDAKQQAKRFFGSHDGFEAGWQPKRLRATSQANDFLCNTAFALTLFLAEKTAEEKKEAEKQKGCDGGEVDDDDSDESEDEKSASFKTPKKPTSDPTKPPPTEVKFDMNDAKDKSIQWQSPNGKVMNAIRVPEAGTRKSFRKMAKLTGWIDNVVVSMYNADKVPEEVGVGWLEDEN
jgi:hypothetical protein